MLTDIVNFMLEYADKCHLLVSGYKNEAMYASVGDALFSFDKYAQLIYKKASQKVTAILRLANIIIEKKKKVLLKTFLSLNSAIAYYSGCFVVGN